MICLNHPDIVLMFSYPFLSKKLLHHRRGDSVVPGAGTKTCLLSGNDTAFA